ncbi:MAG TPA: hypothetical protein VGB49_00155 [Caulobacteraceae bacterium]|jgi:hypothetical protein
MSDTGYNDEQDQAYAFDEDNVDGDDVVSNEMKTFEELPELLDLTRADGDGEDDDFDPDEVLASDGVLAEADSNYLGDEPEATDGDGEGSDPAAHGTNDEVELTFVGSPENVRGAQSSAAHFESRGELSDDDVESLGYGSGEDEEVP